MGLINRKKQHQHSKSEDPSDQTENSSLKTRDDCNNNVVKQFFIALLLAPVLYYTFVIASSIREADISRQNARKYDFNWSQERDGLSLIINFGSDDDVSGLPYNLGPHRVAVSLYREQDLVNCQDNLPVRLRIIGDALLEIPLSKSESYIKEEWKYEDYLTGSFSLPIEGSYKVEATWEECDAGNIKETRKHVTQERRNTLQRLSVECLSQMELGLRLVRSSMIKLYQRHLHSLVNNTYGQTQ